MESHFAKALPVRFSLIHKKVTVNFTKFDLRWLNLGPSASNGEHCICIVFDLFVVRSSLELFCFLSLFLLFYVICTPLLTESTLNFFYRMMAVMYKQRLNRRDMRCWNITGCIPAPNMGCGLTGNHL